MQIFVFHQNVNIPSFYIVLWELSPSVAKALSKFSELNGECKKFFASRKTNIYISVIGKKPLFILSIFETCLCVQEVLL
jgi:hypothetical protein